MNERRDLLMTKSWLEGNPFVSIVKEFRVSAPQPRIRKIIRHINLTQLKFRIPKDRTGVGFYLSPVDKNEVLQIVNTLLSDLDNGGEVLPLEQKINGGRLLSMFDEIHKERMELKKAFEKFNDKVLIMERYIKNL